MMNREFLTNQTICHTLISSLMLFFAVAANAQQINMAPGESKLIHVSSADIGTIFGSDSGTADYEVINPTSFVVYAKKEGKADFSAFDKDGKALVKVKVLVDTVLSDVYTKIHQTYPDSNITINKLGNNYVIKGMVKDEATRDEIYQLVGENIGAKKRKIDRQWKALSNDNDGGIVDFLAQVEYENVINKIELPLPNQVNVKLSVVEVTKEFSDNAGINWNTIGNSAGEFSFVRSNADTLTALVRAISNDGIAKVLAEPNLSVLSGETANFLVGGEIPIVTSSSNGTNVNYKDFGIKLNIGAKVNTKDNIRLTLSQEVSSVSSKITIGDDSDIPALTTRSATTTVELADGDTFLLGGLLSTTEREALSKIPFIGDIPILGAFFRNAATERKKTELVVVATIKLVKPSQNNDVIYPDFRRTSTAARFFNFDSITQHSERLAAENFMRSSGFVQ
ncbi:type II and III secretion system protein family protein [Aeromonas finlandensis]|uniref:type II and III secretion system protein family protein n=1 Tax=Aeromonas finlandensis TaxID=1543375 RepID=UPI0009DE09C8|nr:pilus assembly protein N-terminal domain-containing protein [Aeromonas finlandensis]